VAKRERGCLGYAHSSQVHDELVFEVAESEVDTMKELVKEKMGGAAQLSVPLVVDRGIGPTWSEAH